MWRRGKAGRLIVVSALFGIMACGGETVAGPRLAPPGEAPELTSADAAAVAALAEQWGLMISGTRTALRRLEASHGGVPSARYDEQMSFVRAMLTKVTSDSAASVQSERSSRSRRNPGASFIYGEGEYGVAYAGIIDPQLSTTQFFLPLNPQLYVTTGVTVPAHYILNLSLIHI